jgi:hypothetical protein
MDPCLQLEYFRKEHQDIHLFLEKWERALNLLASKGDAQRMEGLTELRDMEGDVLAVQNHCYVEEHDLETPYRAYLEKAQLEKLRSEHKELGRLAQDLHSELRFATLDSTEGIPDLGRQLAVFVRQHTLFEGKLLAQIEQGLARKARKKCRRVPRSQL